MDAETLRDRTATTRLLIVARLAQGQPTLSQVAQGIGVTVQAVSAHAQQLTRLGWLEPGAAGLRVTPKGMQALHEGVRRLRDAVATIAGSLDVIQVTSALAAAPVAAGEEVGLWMEDGDLVARPGRTATSRGRAHTSAQPGGEVVVGELKGMVQLAPGRLVVMSLPAPAEGGIARVDVQEVGRWLAKHANARRAAHGTGARILARQLGPVHFEFAADHAAFNAAERGLDVTLFASRDRLSEVMASLERLNQSTIRRVGVELVEAPELPAQPPALAAAAPASGRRRARAPA